RRARHPRADAADQRRRERRRLAGHDRRVSRLRAARTPRARRAGHAHDRRRPQRCLHRRGPRFRRTAAHQRQPREYCMTIWYPLLAVLVASLTCAYLRSGLKAWTGAGFAALALAGWLGGSHWLAIALTAAAFAALTIPLNLPDFRRNRLT